MVTIILLCVIGAILAVFMIAMASTVVLASKILTIGIPILILLALAKKIFFKNGQKKSKKKDEEE